VHCAGDRPVLHSFPTRRSSDLPQDWQRWVPDELPAGLGVNALRAGARGWLSLQDGDLQALYLDLAVDQLHLRTRGEPLQLHGGRSEEHTSELQSRENLVCRLLL